jgi:hypothetical protein
MLFSSRYSFEHPFLIGIQIIPNCYFETRLSQGNEVTQLFIYFNHQRQNSGLSEKTRAPNVLSLRRNSGTPELLSLIVSEVDWEQIWIYCVTSYGCRRTHWCVYKVVPCVSILPVLKSAFSLNRGRLLPPSDGRNDCNSHLVPCNLDGSNCHCNVGLRGC